MGFSSVSGLCLGVLSTRDYNTYFESLTWPSVHESITGIPTNPYIATAKTIAPEKKCQATFLSRFFWCSGASSGGQRTMDYLCFCVVLFAEEMARTMRMFALNFGKPKGRKASAKVGRVCFMRWDAD